MSERPLPSGKVDMKSKRYGIVIPIVLFAATILLFITGCQSTPEPSPLEKLETFFAAAETGGVELSITDENTGLPPEKIVIGSTIRVHAKYASFKPKGTYIFYLKPSTEIGRASCRERVSLTV